MRYQSSEVYVYEIKTQKGKSVALTYHGEQLRDYTVSTFGDTAAIMHERAVYTVTLTDLVMTLKD